MAHGYKAIGWTPFKLRFDLWMLAGAAAFMAAFVLLSSLAMPRDESFTPIQIAIRATGALAFLLLTFVLCIGPLARLSPRFLPFLYNRRHLGVFTFLIALAHAGLVLFWYHGFAELNPFVSLLVSNPRYDSIAGFPFESLGVVALIILFVMAATSHDFWNTNLGPGLWKALHMGAYAAYALLVAHVALGAIQFEKHPLYLVLLWAGAATIAGLHLFTGLAALRPERRPDAEGWLRVALVDEMEDTRAKILRPDNGEAIAVFRFGESIAAVSNVCPHQGGPLGEGRIVDGCVTCPWHGFQYRPEDGCAPPPFNEMIATYKTKIVAGIVFVHAAPNPLGRGEPPSRIPKVAP